MSEYTDKKANPQTSDLKSFAGAVGLKTLVKKWDTLSSNMKNYKADAPILLPDLFVISSSSSRISDFIHELSVYLREKKNLMSFSGDVTYYEFMLNYCKPDKPFDEIQRLIDEISGCAGFRYVFKGILHVRIDAWAGHQEEQYFLDFLDYLAENTKDWLIVLSMKKMKDTKTADMEKVLSMFLRIEKITLKTLPAKSYAKEAAARIRQYGLELDKDAMKLLTESIEVLSKNKYFDSSYTIQLLCSDIVYGFYSGKERKTSILTEADLAEFSADSPYIQRTIEKAQEGKKLGFL